jgi:hypothetical protein
MAEGKLQIEQRLNRIEKAIVTMAAWLVEAQTGFGEKDYEGIVEILKDPSKPSWPETVEKNDATVQGEDSG